MITIIIELLTQLSKYFATKEVNYNVRTLRELYEQEQELINTIVDSESNANSNPDPSHILQLTNRLKKTRELISILNSKTISS